jgi:hypothetical protein
VGGDVVDWAKLVREAALTTGRPEFAPQIRPLISNPDNQVYLAAVRSPPRFRPSVLGNDAEQKLAALPLLQNSNIFLGHLVRRHLEISPTARGRNGIPRFQIATWDNPWDGFEIF